MKRNTIVIELGTARTATKGAGHSGFDAKGQQLPFGLARD